MKFRSLQINGWRQYDKIDIQFHDKLTILTGANSSGKTTILNLLGRHFGWNTNFVATARREKSSQFGLILSGVLSERIGRFAYTMTNTGIGMNMPPSMMDDVGLDSATFCL